VRVRRVGGRAVGPVTLALVAAGGGCIGVGAALIDSALGVTSSDVLTTAVAGRAGVSVGVAGALLSVAVYAGCAPFGRWPGWGNLVLLFGVSGAVDATLAVVDEPAAMASRLALYGAGVPLVCLGVALIVRADIGVGPLEMVMLVATDRSVPLVRARAIIEVTTLGVGVGARRCPRPRNRGVRGGRGPADRGLAARARLRTRPRLRPSTPDRRQAGCGGP
jgi:uncharacterized membrane protein YczE